MTPCEMKPCGFKAKRVCPHCRAAVCPGHSKSMSTMDGNLANGRFHRCSHCKVLTDRDEWLPVEATA